MDIKEIKAVIRSLIISCPHGMTIKKLGNDYRQMEGQCLQYKELGFSTMESFLRSIPDTVTVKGTGKEAMVFAICSEKAKHINEMVCKQKSAAKNRKAMVIRENKTFTNTTPATGARTTTNTTGNTANVSNTNLFNSKLSATSAPFMPAQYSGTKSYGNNYYSPLIPNYNYYQQYYNQLNLYNPYQQYYSWMNSYNIPKKIYTDPMTIVNANINQLYNNYKTDSIPRETNIINKSISQNKDHLASNYLGFVNTNTSKSISQNNNHQASNYLGFVNTNNSESISQNNNHQASNYLGFVNTNNSESISQNNQQASNYLEFHNTNTNGSISQNNNQQASNYLESYNTNTNGSISQNNDHQASNSIEFVNSNTKDYEIINEETDKILLKNELKESQTKIESIFKYYEQKQNENLIATNNSLNNNSFSDTSSSTLKAHSKPNSKYMAEFSNYRLCSNFDNNEYDKELSQDSSEENDSFCMSSMKKTMDVSSVDYDPREIKDNMKTKRDHMQRMPLKNNIYEMPHNNQVRKNDENEDDIENNNRRQINSNSSDAIPDIIEMDIIQLIDFPKDVATHNDKIPASEIPTEMIEASSFKLFVSEIHNPFKFWFHFINSSENDLDILMHDIENTYIDLPDKELLMSPANMKPGQICAAIYARLWHRAEILESPIDHKAKVFFIDYGTVSYVDIKHIKYLLKDFCKLPRQLFRGCLSHIKPINHRWTRNATISFLDMTSEKLMYGKITEIDHKENVCYLILIDTNGEKDFQINEALCIKGHAQYNNEFEKYVIEKRQREKHHQEKYPTFSMLEMGVYPSFTEIGEYLAKGIDYEKISDENILPDVGDEDIVDYTKKLICYSEADSPSKMNGKNSDYNESVRNATEIMPALIYCNDDNEGINKNIPNNSNKIHESSLLSAGSNLNMRTISIDEFIEMNKAAASMNSNFDETESVRNNSISTSTNLTSNDYYSGTISGSENTHTRNSDYNETSSNRNDTASNNSTISEYFEKNLRGRILFKPIVVPQNTNYPFFNSNHIPNERNPRPPPGFENHPLRYYYNSYGDQ